MELDHRIQEILLVTIHMPIHVYLSFQLPISKEVEKIRKKWPNLYNQYWNKEQVHKMHNRSGMDRFMLWAMCFEWTTKNQKDQHLWTSSEAS